ncbi:MAG: hypothetical protein ABF634_14260 [Schleiferilactobacillus harbinensis]
MRSNRRQNGLSGGNHTAALPLMWLGDFETAVFAGSKRRHHVPAQFCRRLRSIGTAFLEDFCSMPLSCLCSAGCATCFIGNCIAPAPNLCYSFNL